MLRRAALVLSLMMAALLPLSGCDEAPTTELRVLAGSETRSLEPLIQEFAQAKRAKITMRYAGSVDIRNELNAGIAIAADAVWPANGMWIQLGDTQGIVRYEDSIMRTPVVLGVRMSLARKLGWDKTPPRMADVVGAATKGGLRLGATSGTQSNSGAQLFLGALHALSGRTDALTLADLESTDLQGRVRALLSAVNRSSGSSAWLKDFVVANPGAVDAMANYEAMVVAANQELSAKGAELLYAVYPTDGMTVADHVLGFVDRPGDKANDAKRALFREFRDWLLQEPQQRRIHALGWRTGRVGIEMPNADRTVFRPEWGLDPARAISPVRMPSSEVIAAALDLYQGGGVRKPSETVILYDVSGSMQGAGITAAREGLRAILDQAAARRVLLQAGAGDVLHVIPFSGTLQPAMTIRGNGAAEYAGLLPRVLALEAEGGTDFYTGIEAAWALLEGARAAGRLPAIVLMTDGKSDMRYAKPVLLQLSERQPGENIPILSILFGDADPAQLDELARLSGGRVFDGRRDLTRAFRDARGYN